MLDKIDYVKCYHNRHHDYNLIPHTHTDTHTHTHRHTHTHTPSDHLYSSYESTLNQTHTSHTRHTHTHAQHHSRTPPLRSCLHLIRSPPEPVLHFHKVTHTHTHTHTPFDHVYSSYESTLNQSYTSTTRTRERGASS